jgi:hypothetical protein
MQALSRKLREKFYYKIEVAGAQVGWSRSEAYRAADRGDIPTEWVGKFRMAPKRLWDPRRKKLLRRLCLKPKSSAAAETA